MSTSDRSPVGSGRIKCSCGKSMVFGFELKGLGIVPASPEGERFAEARMYHGDGTAVCEPPPALRPMTPEAQRSALAEARLLAEIEPYEERQRRPFMGVAILFLLLVMLALTCGFATWAWWAGR